MYLPIFPLFGPSCGELTSDLELLTVAYPDLLLSVLPDFKTNKTDSKSI